MESGSERPVIGAGVAELGQVGFANMEMTNQAAAKEAERIGLTLANALRLTTPTT